MAITRKNKLQRNSDGLYLTPTGKWGASNSAQTWNNRADVGLTAQGKPGGNYRKIKEYTVG